MNFNDAISLLKQMCAAFKGTLEEHSLLQQALKIVSEQPKAAKKVTKKNEAEK